MTAPEMMLPSSFLHGSYGSMPPALFHAQDHHNGHQQHNSNPAVPSSTPTENGHLVAPVPQRARNMSMPDNNLLMLPDEPGQNASHRPATSGGFPSSHHHSMPPQASLPPTLAAMPGYAYGAAMLANSNARKAALAAQQSPFAAAAQQQQSMYPFSHDPFSNPQSATMTDDGASSSSRPNTANRPDTASSFTSTSTVGTTDQQQIGTTAIGVDGRLYRFVGVQAQHKKRARRRYDEIERMYNCNYPGCTKAYGVRLFFSCFFLLRCMSHLLSISV